MKADFLVEFAVETAAAEVVKEQIHAGGRGKAGGVVLARSRVEAESAARKLLGTTLVTRQTGPRGRPVENKVVGIRIDDPAPDFARIAQGFGVHAEGPIESVAAVGPALRRALRVVKEDGRPALVDVITRP